MSLNSQLAKQDSRSFVIDPFLATFVARSGLLTRRKLAIDFGDKSRKSRIFLFKMLSEQEISESSQILIRFISEHRSSPSAFGTC